MSNNGLLFRCVRYPVAMRMQHLYMLKVIALDCIEHTRMDSVGSFQDLSLPKGVPFLMRMFKVGVYTISCPAALGVSI